MKKPIFFFIIAWHFCARALTASADDSDVFQPLAPAMYRTQYAGNCGGVSVDLEPDMPPVDDQQQSPWCATFAAKALIEYQQHVAHPGDHYQTRLSAMDVNSWSTTNVAVNRGKFPDMNDGGTLFAVLEGTQASGQVYGENDDPMDQAYYDSSVVAKLARYYTLEKPFDTDQAMACRPQTSNTRALENRFSSLFNVLEKSSDQSSFLNAATAQYSLVPPPAPSARRISISPPYNIRQFAASTGDQFMQELQSNLKARKPSAIQVCFNQMEQLPEIDDPIPPSLSNTCGAHGVDVVGMRTVGGTCQVEIRNSWGTDWPGDQGGGTVWISAKELLSGLGNQRSEVYSISDRAPGSLVQNSVISADGTSFIGETYQRRANGSGTLKLPNGATLSGAFQNGVLVDGNYNGPLGGYYYAGPIVNRETTPDGKWTDKSGNPVQR